MSLYGTRDAVMNWQEAVAKEMLRWGFRRGKYNPCLYWHAESGLMTLVHGDDFVSTGPKHAAETTHAVTASHTALRTTVLPIEATPTYASSISTSVPAVFVRFVASSPRRRGTQPRRARAARASPRSRAFQINCIL